MRLVPTLLALFLLVLGSAVFVGCGGDDSGGDSVAQNDEQAMMEEGREEASGGGSGAGSDQGGSGGGEEGMGGMEGMGGGEEGMMGGMGGEEEGMEDMYGGEEEGMMGGMGGEEEGMEDMYGGEEEGMMGGMGGEEEGMEDMYGDEEDGMEEMEAAYAEGMGGMDGGGEEGMEDMYGGGEEGMEDMESAYAEGMGGMDGRGGPRGSGGRPKSLPEPKTLLDRANLAFQQGRDAEAFQYVYGHAVVAEPEVAKEFLSKMGWISHEAHPHPSMAVRWAVGVDFTGVARYNGSAFPIGEEQKNLGKSNQGGRGGGGGLDMGGSDDGGAPQDFGGQGAGRTNRGGQGIPGPLSELTGELGAKVSAGLQERAARGDFGRLLTDVSGMGRAAPGGRPRSGGGMMMDSEDGMMMDGGEEGMEDMYGGEEGMMGRGGMMMDGGAGGGRGGPRGPGSGQDAGPSQMFPGAVFVGVAPERDLRKRAAEMGADILCVFEVELKANFKVGLITNKTKILLFDVAVDENIFKTKDLNNIQVQNARDNVKGFVDNVDDELTKLFAFIDGNWKLGPVPAGLQSEHVLARIGQILNESHENPLPAACEVRMYHTRGLLQDQHLEMAYQRLFADPQLGTLLATGTEEERTQAITRWLPLSGAPLKQ